MTYNVLSGTLSLYTTTTKPSNRLYAWCKGPNVTRCHTTDRYAFANVC